MRRQKQGWNEGRIENDQIELMIELIINKFRVKNYQQKKFLFQKMTLNLASLFPQLSQKEDHYFSDQEFEVMPYFRELSLSVSEKQLSLAIKKCRKNFRLIRVSKGTVIYTVSMQAQCGYFLCHGAVTLLIKKSNKQKLQTYLKHILHQHQERVKYLNQEFKIPIDLCEELMSQFYEQKVMFKYLQHHQIYGQGYFGFNDLLKNGNRAFTAVATQDTVLLQMDKQKFQSSLKQFQLKRENHIVKAILQNISDSNKGQTNPSFNVSHDLGLKLSQIFNFFVIKTFEKDQIIFKEDEPCAFIYFIVRGEVQLTKKFCINIPKKLVADENKPQIQKEISVKVSRISEKCYLGEVQYFLHTKNRQFTATSIQVNTVLLQIEPIHFIKIIGQFMQLQRDLIFSSKQKFSIANENFLKQKNKVIKLFKQQFEAIENKQKQKIINDLLIDESNHKNGLLQVSNNMNFQIFSKEGMFFRDTFQKLEGFKEFQQTQQNNKRAAIRKYKVSNFNRKIHDEDDLNSFQLKNSSLHINKDQRDEDFKRFDSKEKLLYSPKKNISVLDAMSSTVVPMKQAKKQLLKANETNFKMKKRRSSGKFHELQKDEAIFKRVLIKNGKYEQDKTTFKENIIRPIVHPKFDDIIKQCMSRKNQAIRRAIGQKNIQVVKQTYQNTVESLNKKTWSPSKFSSMSLTCKGTEQFRKKLDLYCKSSKKSESTSEIRNRLALESQTLQACLGINEPPKSSYQKYRYNDGHKISQQEQIKKRPTTHSNNNSRTEFDQKSSKKVLPSKFKEGGIWANSKNNSPQKIVLLNHMMKPITYFSVQY